MKDLERFPEPWSVEDRGQGWLAILDAEGKFVTSVRHREDLHRVDKISANSFLNAREGLALARAIAKLPEFERRPQY